jgi:SAM-dependent methyltransferase
MDKQFKDMDEGGDVHSFYANQAVYAAVSPSRGVGYGSEVSQKARFDMLASHVDVTGKRLLDVGCGAACLLDDLLCRDMVPRSYIGVDIVPEMATLGQGRLVALEEEGMLNDVEASVDLLDVEEVRTGCCDWAVALAVFMIREGSYENTQRIFRNVMNRMWVLADEGIVVDFMSPRARRIDPDVCPVPEEMALRWAFALTDRVVLDASYAPHLYSLILRKTKSTFQKAWDESGGWESA